MCSYILIGFWFTRPSATSVCQKAFVTNHIGEFGLLLGALGLYLITDSLKFQDLFEIVNKLVYNKGVISLFTTLHASFLFIGVIAKFVQFPLHIWLPDDVDSSFALIHAANMVAKGIFL